MLGGTLNLKHAIRLELMNHMKRAADIEVRERIPVAVENDPDAKVTVKKSQPAWEEYKPDPGAPDAGLIGGHRWRVTLGAGEKKLLEAEYVIQIASKNELMGGNRREA